MTDAATEEVDTLFSAARWREGKHWQLDWWRVSAWFGIATDRLMIGVTLNVSGTLGLGLGPVYFGVGLIRG